MPLKEQAVPPNRVSSFKGMIDCVQDTRRRTTQNVDVQESPKSVSLLSRHVSKERNLTVRGINETANCGELMEMSHNPV